MEVVECQGILEGCLLLSTVSVTPAYGSIIGVGEAVGVVKSCW
jgi:hypothetical protein